MIKKVAKELQKHAPFTILGAVAGTMVMFLMYRMPPQTAYIYFYSFHPLHVVLSALVTSSMYRKYRCKPDCHGYNILGLIFIGFIGSIGIATLSDSIIPYISEKILGLPNAHPHIGFLERWEIILPLAAIGIAIAYFRPATKSPHAAHIGVSTAASLFHMMMANAGPLSLLKGTTIFVFLFIAVWVPCCFSDIVFPLLFTGNEGEKK